MNLLETYDCDGSCGPPPLTAEEEEVFMSGFVTPLSQGITSGVPNSGLKY
ncbi:unnamed protein product, partial [Amoebophrya sp. A25]|eukprot:GSA25T00007811001.1